VSFIDLPGSGERIDEKCPLSIDEIVETTRQYYKEEFVDGYRRVLISISLGGMVGTSWTSRYADFDEFIIVNSSFKNLSALPKRVQPSAMVQFINVFLTFNHKKREEKVVKLCSNNPVHYEDTIEKWTRIAHEAPMSMANMARQTFAASQFSLSGVPKAKTLVIAAKSDRLCHYSCSEKIIEAWECDSHFFDEEHIGHGVHMDAPNELAQVIFERLGAKAT
jgi:pimeloyl-[acyl-carrier protein] methyl ester esterase